MSYLWNGTKEILRELKILAAREGRTIKEILDEQAQAYIKTHKEGNPQHLLTKYTENEDFMGFPAIALSPMNKRKALKNMPEDMKQELQYHAQSWLGMIKEP